MKSDERARFMKELLLKGDKTIGIYGTGLAGETVFYALLKMDIQTGFFLDGNSEKIGKTFCGREIVDISRVSKNAFVFIAANPVYRIHERLSEKGINQWEYVDPEFLHLLSEGYNHEKIESILKRDQDKISRVYEMLEDEKSKTVFQSVLQHRLEHNLSLISNIYDENQYFGNDVIGKINGNFVDCGAYTGDTLSRFMSQVSGPYHYYAFEAEKVNCDEIMEYCREKGISDINLYNIALHDKKGRLKFLRDEGQEKVSGKAVEAEGEKDVYMQADSIDNVLKNIEIDMITMDIEGAEIRALRGACESINRWYPKLAISAYHAIEHLWEIPLLIQEINPDYRFFYRHHRWNMHDTVCYAIHKDDRCK